MKSFLAFLKKEWLEHVRAGRLVVLALIFTALGIMNPAIAKLTPWILSAFSETLAESGMTITDIQVDALTSWTQFYKNIPLGLMAIILLESNILTREIATGSLIPPLTKGLARYKVVLAKSTLLALLWTGGFWLSYGITYGYNAFYWDNDICNHLALAAGLWWLSGLLMMAVLMLFSTLASSNTFVLVGAGLVYLTCYILSLLPKLASYSPAYLKNGMALLTGQSEAGDYTTAIVITLALCAGCLVASIPLFNKTRL